jgi:2'-5' RNA ligase
VGSIVVVAIPSRDEQVWRISSEKTPHLTLLYLDDQINVRDRVLEFTEHVVNTTLPKFGMDVDRRGVLGPKEADVLFFGEYGRQRLLEFRAYLLTNPEICKAYDAAEQFPEWTPHLTLGYPDNPAKEEDQSYPTGMNWVNFDKVAIWTDDSEGVEFPLRNDNSLTMSEKGPVFLSHYGVKGMRWGVIRDRIQTAKNSKAAKYASASADHKRAAKVRTKAKVIGVQSLTNDDLQKVISRMNLELQYKNLKRVEHEQSLLGKGKRWAGKIFGAAIRDLLFSSVRPADSTPSRGKAWIGEQPSLGGSNRKAIGS